MLTKSKDHLQNRTENLRLSESKWKQQPKSGTYWQKIGSNQDFHISSQFLSYFPKFNVFCSVDGHRSCKWFFSSSLLSSCSFWPWLLALARVSDHPSSLGGKLPSTNFSASSQAPAASAAAKKAASMSVTPPLLAAGWAFFALAS